MPSKTLLKMVVSFALLGGAGVFGGFSCAPQAPGGGGNGLVGNGGGSPMPTCGDGIPDQSIGEECDDGNRDNTDDCLNNCTKARCGDSYVEAGVEECDDGNDIDTDACPSTCLNATCGDGFLEAGVEDCDDGNEDDNDSCSNACKAGAGCGNGHVDAGEECDDGNKSNADACTNACKNAVCGDGYAELGVEQCDDGNTIDNDACSNTCHVNMFQSYGCPGIPVTVDVGPGQTIGGTISQSTNAYQGSCGGNGADFVYAVTPSVSGVMTLTMLGVDPDVDPVLYVRDACDAGNELGCSDVTFSGQSEELVLAVTGGQTYYVFADTYSDSSMGNFNLSIDLSTMVAGDDCPGVDVPLTLGSSKTLFGNTSVANPDRTGTGLCHSPATKDIVYKVVPPDDGTLTVTLDPTYDGTLYIRASSCTAVASQVACSESAGVGGIETLSIPVTHSQSYFVIVDGNMGSAGSYNVEFDLN